MYRSSSWTGLRAPHDVERDGLVRVAAETFHFEITVTRIESIAKRGRWLRRSLKAKLSARAFVGCATIVGPFRDYQRDSIDAFYDQADAGHEGERGAVRRS
jgi:hypothetical protein